MSGSFLLDTNIAIAFLEGESVIVDRVTQAEGVLLSSTIVGELYYGAFKSGRVASNVERVEVLIQRIPVLDCDKNTSKVYGQIKNQLCQKGRPLPENDIWIAVNES
jgi:tRNA(fMet)-specific endonuclease VapC